MKRHFFVLAAVIISTQLNAQKDTAVLDEAVITANKYPNKTSLTGKVVTIISKEQLERSGGKDLSQVLTEQAGVFIAGANSNTGKDKSLYLRGARIEHTLITVDGIPVYDPSGIGNNFDIRNISLANIERIEILKGSQSTLYGSDAIAGVINIITGKAPAKKISGNASVSYGSNETFRVSTGINGQAGIVDYNASYSLHNTKGINEAVSNTASVTDRDGFNQNNFQARLGIKPSENVHIQPFFRLSNIKGDIDQGAFTDELDYTYTQKSWQAGARNEFSFGKANLTVIYSFNTIKRLYTDDSVKSRNGYDTWAQGDYKGQEHFADAYITAPFTQQLKLTGGIDYRSSQSDQTYSSVGFWGPYKTEYSSDSLNQNQTGIYAALNWNTKKGFNAEAGGRVNFHSEYGSYAVFNINPSYLINKKIKVFANLSSAYRTPSLYQLFSEYGNKELRPEAAISTEAGLQYITTDNKFTGRAVAFWRNVKNVIFFFYNPSTFRSQYINQDKQKDHGFELEATYHFTKNITLKIFYAYVTGEITTKTSGKDTTYSNLLRRPKSSIGISLAAQIRKNFFMSSNLMSAGKRKDAYFDNNTFATVNTTLKSYILWDLYAEYGFMKNRLRLFADIRNITGSKYTEISGFNTPGINGYGGIRFNF
ncbi:MAG: TonB-dependent receptor plug domain-containing protein [Bacteroidota bacterium]